jgi:hypothetical protein
MFMPLPTRAALAAAALAALVAAGIVHAVAPAPSASVARGTEDAFASGLHRRELPPRQPPLRWTTDRVAVRFEHLPPGPAQVDVALSGHRGPVVVSSDGVVLGTLAAGTSASRFDLPVTASRSRRVQLDVPVFVAGDGRRLGARLGHLTVHPARRGLPGGGLALVFAIPALAAIAAARAGGFAPAGAAACAIVVTVLHAALLWPAGLARSPMALRQAALLAACLLAAGAAARWAFRGGRGDRWAFAALSTAFVVQGLLGTSPVMVVSDAVFHANMLGRVAAGDWFPVSVTQHARPFRVPYGVSFYALLVPGVRAGIDTVTLVRAGAAAAGLAASFALLVVLRRGYGAAAAGLAVVLLQLVPLTFDVGSSHGNFSNAFGQAATIGFFAWWTGEPRRARGAAAGALLFAAAALAHLSTLIVAVALGAALAVARARRGGLGPARKGALAAGLVLAAAYYAQYSTLVLEQAPRLLEGGGRAASGLGDALRAQAAGALWGFGPAVLALAWFGRPRMRSALDRDLAAWWIGVGALALPAVVSPLEVRYLYALVPPLAAAAGLGLATLHAAGGRRRAAGWALAGLAGVAGIANLAEAVFARYRPYLL